MQEFEIALLYFALEDRDRGLEQLTKALAARPNFIWYIDSEPRFDSVRGDPRLQNLINRYKSSK